MDKEGASHLHLFVLLFLDLRSGGPCKSRREQVLGQPWFPILFLADATLSFSINTAVTGSQNFAVSHPASRI
ncbi:MAG TPA: hypothetical protein VLK23_12840, partial [Thermodesulfobacteriota bacterium]|nr:hypothetical protein [Thermodesulfobacteriota bacterium]